VNVLTATLALTAHSELVPRIILGRESRMMLTKRIYLQNVQTMEFAIERMENVLASRDMQDLLAENQLAGGPNAVGMVHVLL
jgi:hypothetical protein